MSLAIPLASLLLAAGVRHLEAARTVQSGDAVATGLAQVSEHAAAGIMPMIPMAGLYTASKFEYDPRPGTDFASTTLIDMLEKAAEVHPDDIAFQVPHQDLSGDLVEKRSLFGILRSRLYSQYTWKEYRDQVMVAAAGFIAHGLKPMDTVNIRGVNSAEWLVAFLGCVAAGGLPVGVYPTDSAETLEFKARDSEAVFIVVGTAEDAAIYQKFAGKLGSLKAMVVWTNNLPRDTVPGPFLDGPNRPRFLYWDEFVGQGRGEGTLLARIGDIKPGQAAAVVYTSGATGPPKGVMLSHDSLSWVASVMHSNILRTGKHRVLSHMPLSHVTALMFDVVWPLYASQAEGASVVTYFSAGCFVEKRCVTEQLLDAKPTVMLGTPEVWDDLRMAAEMAIESGREEKGEQFDEVMLAAHMGLNRLEAAISFDGAITRDTLRFFHKRGRKILNVFAQSESAGLGTAWTPEDFDRHNLTETLGSIGKPLGNDFQLSSSGAEIMLKGRNVMLGYVGRFGETQLRFTEDGWLKTGDLAELDWRSGHAFFAGRMSEMIENANFHQISPFVVEQGIKEACNADGEIVKHVVVQGTGAPYLSALFTLFEKVTDGVPTGELIGDSLSLSDATATTVAAAQTSALWSYRLGRCVSAYNNENTTVGVDKVWRFAILPVGITPESDPELMTPLHKIKRKGVSEKYKDLIETCSRAVEPGRVAMLLQPSPCVAPGTTLDVL